ncbi:septal ring lytic transglycosylase RlpA family protein [Modicisalibacter tunisiensis]|uniref:Endolytic peptidoglycan transglycosylase RlpA n=1 Tax=Modicisalibacter tunisiensis TaxID=390637 RepID=A0ABS7X348_9GAMM|nr:septal ring lytic transglycosylase RlpA family protein [Modicisalibacter tunisiensis]MBZ9568889.1 septal ring lytic transglycosylase RlpA family protein [Modicisalibacter tunisiensis]
MRGVWWRPVALATLLALAGCAGDGARQGGGRYAMGEDAYPDSPPDVSQVPDAVPRVEPRAESGNRPTYRVWGKTYHVLSDPQGYAAEGTASWYGKKFQGYDTASGEPYDMYKMTAAHRTLPLPTYARVTNTGNGRSVIVRINDRGPFHGDRLIDLSYAAAARLGILRHGTGHVRVVAIDPVAWQARHGTSTAGEGKAVAAAKAATKRRTTGATRAAPAAASPSVSPLPSRKSAAAGATASGADPGAFYLQVAALGSAGNAERLRRRLQSRLDRPVRVDNGGRLHRVQVGPVADRPALEALRRELQQAGFAQAFTVTAGQQ